MNFVWATEMMEQGKIVKLSNMFIYKLDTNGNDFLFANINHNPKHWWTCRFSLTNIKAVDWELFAEDAIGEKNNQPKEDKEEVGRV